MPDIILVRVADKAMPIFKRIGAVQHPMNLLYLATWLSAHGHTAEIVDLEVQAMSELEEKLVSAPALLVGITAMTPNIPEATRICSLCRSLGIKTVLGGPHPTALPAQTLIETGCDYVVLGEGEKPLSDLLSCIKQNQSPDHIKALSFIRNSSCIINERPAFIDLDELPIPNRRLLKLDLYHGEATPGILGKAAIIFTSRGCPFACTFCASKVINQQKVRFRNMKKIFEEIDDIVKLGFNHLTVEDDTFTLNSNRVREFCLYLISKHPRLTWDCDARVDTLDEGQLKLMRDSNCKKIAFGVESGSSRILRSINKQIDISQAKETFRLAKKYKIMVQAFFMIGYPEETPEDLEATEKLIFEIDPDLLFLSVVVPYPGTFIYDYMLNRGFLPQSNWDSFIFFGEEVPWHTAYFNGKQLLSIRKRISRKFYFRFSYIVRRIFLIRSSREALYLLKGAVAAFIAFCYSGRRRP